MKDYIERNRLKTVIEKNFGHGTISPILQLIDQQSTADVAPVMHGEWVPNESDRHHHCSVCMEDALCKEDWQFLDCVEILSEYCPNCGARMDGAE